MLADKPIDAVQFNILRNKLESQAPYAIESSGSVIKTTTRRVSICRYDNGICNVTRWRHRMKPLLKYQQRF